MRELGYAAPSGLAEAGRILLEVDGAMALAGGTDVVVARRLGKIAPALVVDLKRIPGLDEIRDTEGAIEIGALASMTTISRSSLVGEYFPALATAAGVMGCWQVRNLATLGGNLCNASPSAETAPPLLVYEAVALIDGANGPREVPMADFFTGPGTTVLARGELLAGVRLPKEPQGLRSAYARRALRRSMDIPLVNTAVALRIAEGVVEEARLALGAVAPVPFRVRPAEEVLVDRRLDGAALRAAAEAACASARPITDVRATAEYRLAMIDVVVRRALAEVAEEEVAA